MSSMIPSARPTVPPVAIIFFKLRLFCFERFKGRADEHMCENNDHYQQGLWVGGVDQ